MILMPMKNWQDNWLPRMNNNVSVVAPDKDKEARINLDLGSDWQVQWVQIDAVLPLLDNDDQWHQMLQHLRLGNQQLLHNNQNHPREPRGGEHPPFYQWIFYVYPVGNILHHHQLLYQRTVME